MDLDQETPNSESLKKLPYSELRKVAIKYGIKRRQKVFFQFLPLYWQKYHFAGKLTNPNYSEKLIAAILSKNSDTDTDEMFSTPAVKELNSSRKNKEKKFDEVQMTPLATPRRGTYSLDTPFSVKTEDLSPVSLTVNASDLDLSNVTINRGSERKLRPRKVSFMSPTMTPRTPKSQSLRNRPKTPIASRTPLRGNISFEMHIRKSIDDSFLDTTTEAKTVKFEESDMESSINPESANSPPQPLNTQETKEDVGMTKIKLSPQNVKSSATEENVKQLTSKKRVTLRDIERVVTKEPTSVKRGATPNFRRIHEKAFQKMESIDDYQKRKLVNSAKKISQRPNFKSKVTKAKSKIPGYHGIPFIPSVSGSSSLKTNTTVNNLLRSVDNHKAAKENTPQPVKKIDLKERKFTRKDNLQLTSKFDNKNKNLSRKETPQSVKNMDLKAKKVTRKETPQSVKNMDLKTKRVTRKETPQSVKSKSKFDLKASLSRKLGYKPYKGPLRPLSESNSLHASSFISAKEPVINKVVNENRSQTRSVIRGVRMNKRFELQMRNRKLD